MHLNVIGAASEYLTFSATVEAELMGRLKARNEALPIPCKAGCFGCCHQIVGVSFLEAVSIALEVLLHEDRDLLHRVCKAAQEFRDPEMDITGHFERGVPCVLLDDDGKCGMYAARPFACRTHLVVSDIDVKQCWPRSLGGTADAPSLKVTKLHQRAAEKHAQLAPSNLTHAIAPLPVMVMFTAELLSRDTDRHGEVIPYLEGWPLMTEWCNDHLTSQSRQRAPLAP